ncbi:GGDEF domain-containing protein [Streptomyces sp. DSM 44915]|uniref:GGDEF domain-containing protein n=1 Tax=Streptomyces chisholmiae TaxID=3075540 RepID=A0ABU2JZR6_9ACTN|nr:GGDEF domain-containing protein [Streptomyces sp. DSM 44915]MDT0270034.1 GGDEF domain-containing protein [Streptomyces sp. DSM 44915]
MSSLIPALASAVPVAAGWSAHSMWLRRRLEVARRDPLTGLRTRAGFESAAARLVARRSVAVIFVDLDGFKQLNDRLGHATGDQAIRVAGTVMTETIGDGRGVVGRLGGDEFVAVVPLPGSHALPWLLNGLHECLTTPFVYQGRSVSHGASLGGVFAPAGGSLSVLLRRADEAMYAAKRDGGGWRVADLDAPHQPTTNGRRPGRTGGVS